jgi:hypothetical protein
VCLAVLALKVVLQADVQVARVLGVGLAGQHAPDGLTLTHLAADDAAAAAAAQGDAA